MLSYLLQKQQAVSCALISPSAETQDSTPRIICAKPLAENSTMFGQFLVVAHEVDGPGWCRMVRYITAHRETGDAQLAEDIWFPVPDSGTQGFSVSFETQGTQVVAKVTGPNSAVRWTARISCCSN